MAEPTRDKWEIGFEIHDWGRTAALHVYANGENGTFWEGTPVEMKERAIDLMPVPALQLPAKSPAIQKLMDSMWNYGIRPSEGVLSQGKEEALSNHLEDAIVVRNRLLNALLQESTG